MKAQPLTRPNFVKVYGANTLTVYQTSDLSQVRVMARRTVPDSVIPGVYLTDAEARDLAYDLLARVNRRRLLTQEGE
jgi:hypothetical protein